MKGNRRRTGLMMALILAGVLLLTGCSREEETIVIGKGQSAEETTSEADSTSASAAAESIDVVPATDADASSTEDATSSSEESEATSAESLAAEAIGPPASQIFFDPYYTEKNEETAEITGLTSIGEELWTVDAGKYPATELIQVKEIGIKNDLYYYLEGGNVVALDLRTGKPAWTNKEFGGASATATFDDKGVLYLCGLYRPDLFIVDKNGHTVTRVELFDQGYDQPDGITVEDDELIIHYAGNNGNLHIDRKTYKIAGNVAPKNGYSDEELMRLAVLFAGYENAEVESREKSENEVLLHVYVDGEEAVETLNWYWIDPRTGEGEDINGTHVDFKNSGDKTD